MGGEALGYELEIEPASIAGYLAARGWLADGERVLRAEIAGAGNMNRTVRVTSSKRSFILKQSRPYCVKFPEIPAPIERLGFEVDFYRIARRSARLAERLPEVLAYDDAAYVAMIEDLGSGSDLLALYSGERLAAGELELLCELARELHTLDLADGEGAALRNRAMRELNHEHIFDIPLRPANGLDLEAHTPGLDALAQSYKRDARFVARVAELGALYLEAEGPALLHGDYYPGSFLRTPRGLAVIDPEFGFFGPAEFDLGVLAAHLGLAGAGDDIVDQIVEAYGAPVDRALVAGFAGAESMRRLLGVSQLPLDPRVADLARKSAWLERSRRWLLGA